MLVASVVELLKSLERKDKLVCSRCDMMDTEDYRRMLTPTESYSYYPMRFLSDVQNMAKVQVMLEGVKYDTLVGTGLSGTLVVPRLAEYLGKDWAIVRKRDENSHRERLVEGTQFGKRWIFVDDFMQYGGTTRRVLKEVSILAERSGFKTTFVGKFFYNKFEWEPWVSPTEDLKAAVEKDLGRLEIVPDLTEDMMDLYDGKYDRGQEH